MLAHLMVILLLVLVFLNVPYIAGRLFFEKEANVINAWLIGTTMITLIFTFFYLMYILTSLFMNIIPQ